MSSNENLAPEITASDWLNTDLSLTLEQLRGQIVVIFAFQMLCPGCVSRSLPQAKLLHTFYDDKPVQVIGLHTVFEHHQAMQKHALEAFVYEYQLKFPIAIDAVVKDSPIPETMGRYRLQGTPSLIVIDHLGKLQLQHFGHLEDLALGHIIGSLLAAHPFAAH